MKALSGREFARLVERRGWRQAAGQREDYGALGMFESVPTIRFGLVVLVAPDVRFSGRADLVVYWLC
jgi:hypothetical protein